MHAKIHICMLSACTQTSTCAACLGKSRCMHACTQKSHICMLRQAPRQTPLGRYCYPDSSLTRVDLRKLKEKIELTLSGLISLQLEKVTLIWFVFVQVSFRVGCSRHAGLFVASGLTFLLRLGKLTLNLRFDPLRFRACFSIHTGIICMASGLVSQHLL